MFVRTHFDVWTSRKSFAEILTTLTSLEATEPGAGGGAHFRVLRWQFGREVTIFKVIFFVEYKTTL